MRLRIDGMVACRLRRCVTRVTDAVRRTARHDAVAGGDLVSGLQSQGPRDLTLLEELYLSQRARRRAKTLLKGGALGRDRRALRIGGGSRTGRGRGTDLARRDRRVSPRGPPGGRAPLPRAAPGDHAQGRAARRDRAHRAGRGVLRPRGARPRGRGEPGRRRGGAFARGRGGRRSTFTSARSSSGATSPRPRRPSSTCGASRAGSGPPRRSRPNSGTGQILRLNGDLARRDEGVGRKRRAPSP